MNSVNLNLARKWRSRNFDQIVGQDLSIRMLKNSLYLDQYFPVYLFSGQRGCGKTTTGRVFAAAVNCERLSDFRINPKTYTVPCLECASCRAMVQGKHPDFIEIDAASHTGVDNVRQIIDDSQLLPLMGRKKIYLIDEAHMLSKAAFNAFLKVLEEPPASVLFILATTDEQKIIETVRSRCFQLFFKSVGHDPLRNHLKQVCDAEKIAYEDGALSIVITETQGSVRDALNVLEQVKFARGKVTQDAVLQVLGHVDDTTMIALLDTVLNKQPHDVLSLLQSLHFQTYAADFVWNKLAELVRAGLWIHYGVTPEWAQQYTDQLTSVVRRCSAQRLNSVLKLFYEYEIVFAKTAAKHSLLELILLQVCQKNVKESGSTGSAPASQNAASPVVEDVRVIDEDEEVDGNKDDEEEEEEIIEEEGSSQTNSWQAFLRALEQLNDPLLTSIFKNGSVVHYDAATGQLMVVFAQQFSFFKETLEETTTTWIPHMRSIFGNNVVFNPQFTGQQKIELTASKKVIAPVTQPVLRSRLTEQSTVAGQQHSHYASHGAFPYKRPMSGIQKMTSTYSSNTQKPFDISDVDVWKKANMITRYFPGSITELHEAQT
jgi:DNA polymerase III subunit gamma/tau